MRMKSIQVAGIVIGAIALLAGLSFVSVAYMANGGMDSMMAGNSHQHTGDECAWHDEHDAGDCCHDGPNDDGVGAEEFCHDDSEAGNGHHQDETCLHDHDMEHEHSEDGEECHEHDGHGMMGHMMGF